MRRALALLSVLAAVVAICVPALAGATRPGASARVGGPIDDPGQPLDASSAFVTLDAAGEIHGLYGYGDEVTPAEPAGVLGASDVCTRELGDAYVGQRRRAVVVLGDAVEQFVEQRLGLRIGIPDLPVGVVVVSVLDPAAQARPEFEARWLACLVEAAEEGTRPAATTLAGVPVLSVKLDDPGDRELDAVTWLEPGLEIYVVGDFGQIASTSVRETLERFANPVEPALDVAGALAARNHDELTILVDEAFAPVSGVSYGEPTAGFDARARTAVRQGAGPDALSQLRAAVERPVRGDGADFVQVMLWEPTFLTAERFEGSWLEGLGRTADPGTPVDPVDLGGVVGYGSVAEGVHQVAYLAPCYAVKVSGDTRAGVTDFARRLVVAQRAARATALGTADLKAPAEACSRTNLARVKRGDADEAAPET